MQYLESKAPVYLCILLGLAGKRQSGVPARQAHNDRRMKEQTGMEILESSERRKGSSGGRISVEENRSRSHMLSVTSEDSAGGFRNRKVWNQDPRQSYSRWVRCDGERSQSSFQSSPLWPSGFLQVLTWPEHVLETNVVSRFVNWRLLWEARPTYPGRTTKPKQMARWAFHIGNHHCGQSLKKIKDILMFLSWTEVNPVTQDIC